jgi:hypothetical protein
LIAGAAHGAYLNIAQKDVKRDIAKAASRRERFRSLVFSRSEAIVNKIISSVRLAATGPTWLDAIPAGSYANMTDDNPENWRYFVSYTGVKLPLKLINQLEVTDLNNRNTFIRASFDGQERLLAFEKMVYGEVEMWHRYEYDPGGVLRRAEISMDDEVTELRFDASGVLVGA